MGGWFGSQGECERRIKKKFWGGGVGLGESGWWGGWVRVDGNEELKFL